MKKVRMIVSAALVFAVVGGALAFKPYGAGSITCYDNSVVSNVLTNQSCNSAQQPTQRRNIDFAVSTNISDPTSNPCLSSETPFDASVSGACTQKTPGTDHFKSTDL